MKEVNTVQQQLNAQMRMAQNLKALDLSFENLNVWQIGHEIVKNCYDLTSRFPQNESQGLVQQLRTTAINIPSLIAEGFRNPNTSRKLKLFNEAFSKNDRLKYLLLLSQDLDYGSNMKLTKNVQELEKALNSYIRTIKNNLAFDFSPTV